MLLPTLAGHGQHPGRERLCDEGMLAREREQLFFVGRVDFGNEHHSILNVRGGKTQNLT